MVDDRIAQPAQPARRRTSPRSAAKRVPGVPDGTLGTDAGIHGVPSGTPVPPQPAGAPRGGGTLLTMEQWQVWARIVGIIATAVQNGTLSLDDPELDLELDPQTWNGPTAQGTGGEEVPA